MTTPTAQQPWQLDRGRSRGEMGYLPGLDGIRALAVLGVLLYHADLGWLRGGFLGVDVFFVLSGFLITSLILEELDRSGRVDFTRFYIGRARRLLPALLLMLIIVGAVVAIWYRDAAYQFARDSLASALYVNNWWYIATDLSYFESIGRPPLLNHLWSLAVEEQFYLVWPLLAFVVYRRFHRRGVGIFALVLALASTAWMITMSVSQGFPDFADPSRAYFGTDSHAMGLLIGAALATFWRPGRLRADVSPGARTLVTGVGVVALGSVIGFLVFVGEYTPWMYRGGFLVLAVIVAVLIAAASHPASRLGPIMGMRPWRYLGQRSYGLYLWHWPIFMLTRPVLDIPLDGVWLLATRLGMTVLVAELSFRFVEMPIRRGVISRWWRQARLTGGHALARARVISIAVIGALLAGVLALGLSLAQAAEPGVPADVAEAIGSQTDVTIDTPEPSPSSSASPSASASGVSRAGLATGIGDSVMLGAREVVRSTIPGIKIDAAVARYPGAFLGRIKKLRATGLLADTVVLHPGTNGVLPESMMRDILDLLADRERVVIVNDNVPRPWNDANNEAIASVVPDYPNAVIADWKSASQDHPEYFVSDGIHLTAAGARAYANLLRKVAAVKVPKPPTETGQPTQ
ncbi:MAG: acyltransferase family protein [Actinomycetes bacterium]